MNNTILVNHTTKVILPFFNEFSKDICFAGQLEKFLDEQERRLALVRKIVKFLAARNFEFEYFKDKIVAYSDTEEAFQIKQDLLNEGFSSKDFCIRLDYARKWGIL